MIPSILIPCHRYQHLRFTRGDLSIFLTAQLWSFHLAGRSCDLLVDCNLLPVGGRTIWISASHLAFSYLLCFSLLFRFFFLFLFLSSFSTCSPLPLPFLFRWSSAKACVKQNLYTTKGLIVPCFFAHRNAISAIANTYCTEKISLVYVSQQSLYTDD